MVEDLVNTKNGTVKGKKEDGIYKWLGIPYASKPLGELRFRRAKPVQNWEGILETIKTPNRPLQSNDLTPSDTTPSSEDCLYLSIWSSGGNGKKPVLIMLCGGAFIVGDASMRIYDGTDFALHDIVVVGINYRVGILGGYDFSIYADYEEHFDSGIFMSDIVEAMKWIHENIEFFGGDANNITVAGVSAGATAALTLPAIPEAKGLYHKIICDSGIPNAVVSKKVGKISMDMLLEHMRILPTELHKLKECTKKEYEDNPMWLLNNFTYRYPGLYLAGPIVGDYIKKSPLDAFKDGDASDIKLLIGTTPDESSMFMKKKNTNMCYTKEHIEEMFENNKISKEMRKRILNVYPSYPRKRAIKDINTHINFTLHSSIIADYQCQFNDTYMYRFDYATLLAKLFKFGSYHSQDIGFAFNTYDKSDAVFLFKLTSKKTIHYFVNMVQSVWINFMKTGNPNGLLDLQWPKYESEKKQVYIMDKKCSVEKDPYRKIKEAWEGFPFYEN